MRPIVWMVAGILCLGAGPAWAMHTPVHEAAESPQYGRKFGGMIGRGLLNAVTCFVDVIVNVVNDTKSGPPLVGTLTGVAKGAGCGVLRLGSGAVDLVTFWVPGFNGFPVSDSYENCFATETPSATMSEMAPAVYSPPPVSTMAPATPPSAVSSSEPAPEASPRHAKKKKWAK